MTNILRFNQRTVRKATLLFLLGALIPILSAYPTTPIHQQAIPRTPALVNIDGNSCASVGGCANSTTGVHVTCAQGNTLPVPVNNIGPSLGGCDFTVDFGSTIVGHARTPIYPLPKPMPNGTLVLIASQPGTFFAGLVPVTGCHIDLLKQKGPGGTEGQCVAFFRPDPGSIGLITFSSCWQDQTPNWPNTPAGCGGQTTGSVIGTGRSTGIHSVSCLPNPVKAKVSTTCTVVLNDTAEFNSVEPAVPFTSSEPFTWSTSSSFPGTFGPPSSCIPTTVGLLADRQVTCNVTYTPVHVGTETICTFYLGDTNHQGATSLSQQGCGTLTVA